MKRTVITHARKRTLHDLQPRSLPARLVLRLALLAKACLLALVNAFGSSGSDTHGI